MCIICRIHSHHVQNNTPSFLIKCPILIFVVKLVLLKINYLSIYKYTFEIIKIEFSSKFYILSFDYSLFTFILAKNGMKNSLKNGQLTQKN